MKKILIVCAAVAVLFTGCYYPPEQDIDGTLWGVDEITVEYDGQWLDCVYIVDPDDNTGGPSCNWAAITESEPVDEGTGL